MTILHSLRFSLRGLARDRFYASINVSGLALGMVCCMLLSLYVRHEQAAI